MTVKPSLRERIAALKSKEAAPVSKFSAKEAKTRVAASWTIAKTLLPAAPSEVQYKLASSLLANGTNALGAILRQAAVNAHYTKLAEKFEEMHKVELNELIEDPSLLSKMQKEVQSELKGEAKNASKAKKADGENEEEAPPAMPPVDMAPEGEEEELPLEGEEGAVEDADADITMDEAPASPAEAKKEVILEQINAIKDDVAALEEEVSEGEELDFSAIFDEEGMEDKTNDLADEEFDGDIEASADDFFGPSSASELEGAMDTEGMEFADASDFFSHNASTSSMDDLFTDSKSAAKDDTYAPGEMADSIVAKGNVADAEVDHEGDILMDVLSDIKDVAFDNAEYKRTTEPKFEKAAAKKKASAPLDVKRPIRSLGNVKTASPEKARETAMLASLVFPDDETFG